MTGETSRTGALGDVAAELDCAASAMSDDDVRLWLDAAARFRSRVAAYIRRTTHEPDDVAELLSEVWASAWCARGDSPTGLPSEVELIGHARYACACWKRVHRREIPAQSAGGFRALALDIERPQNEAAEEFLRTLEWMRELPQQQRYAVCFRLLRGASFDAVAAASGCSVSAAKTHYWRGVAVLRRRRAELSAGELNAM